MSTHPKKSLRVTKSKKGMATTRSTGGAGFAFEDQVGSWLLLKMLSGESIPGMNGKFGTRLQTQTSALGWSIDDLLVTGGQAPDEFHFAVSCKSNAQVTATGMPDDFVTVAWQLYASSASGPMRPNTDGLALVTRGRHDAFQATWTDIKNAASGSDTALALARIGQTRKHQVVFDNIKQVVRQSAAASDEDILEFIRHLHVIPTDFDVEPSEHREAAIAQCRRILSSSSPQDARSLWNALVDTVRKARLGGGTIDLQRLWHEFRSQFWLADHPDWAADWTILRALTLEHLDKIEVCLPSGHSLQREEDAGKFGRAMEANRLTVLYGDSGSGKSALAKSMLTRGFPDATQVWLGPDILEAAVQQAKRSQMGLAHSLSTTLAGSASGTNILVLDAAERINADSAIQVRQLIHGLLAATESEIPPAWRILIIGQTEAWIDGRLLALFGVLPHASVAINTASAEEVRNALRATPQLSWLALHDDAVTALMNLRALAWVVQAAQHFQQRTSGYDLSLTVIADLLWRFWTDGQFVLQGMLMRFGRREASFEHSVAVSELEPAEAVALQQRPPQLPLRVTARNRVEFQHDLAADWARFQYLKEVADDLDSWGPLAENPLWGGALRMLGQFLLRERRGGHTAWDLALEKLTQSGRTPSLAVDILLDALCLDPLAERLLTERVELLLANHGALLNRLLQRFHHMATVPSGPPGMLAEDASISLYVETLYRMPIVTRWPAVIRFLNAQRNRIAALMSPVIARLCERWLTTMPLDLGPGTAMPFRKELAELALATARALQVGQGQGIIFADDSEKPIYSATLAGAPDCPEDVSDWALEMAQRKDWRTDVVAQIVEHHERQNREREERLRTDPVYRMRQERLARAVTIGPSSRRLLPWPLGPNERVEKDFRECCTGSQALIPLMRIRPSVAAEVLLAAIIEDSPEEEYGVSYRLDEQFGLEYDRNSYPTAYWKSPFYAFLQINSAAALEALVKLVDFCTERWAHDMHRHGVEHSSIAIALTNGTANQFIGNHSVFDWSGENSLNAGQMHSALAALEKWLCAQIENGADVSPYMERLLCESNSVAILGVLTNVGKFRPELFQGVLRPMLAVPSVYCWDEQRLLAMQYRFDSGAWARQGQAVFQAARDWHAAPYRSVSLRRLASSLVAFRADIADFLAAAVPRWDAPQEEKANLQFRLLKAELDRNNYTEAHDASGQEGIQFSYPESLRREVEEFQRGVAPAVHALTLPIQCTKILAGAEDLTPAQAEALGAALSQATPETGSGLGDRERNAAKVAAAATLFARGASWLALHPDAKDAAKDAVLAVVDRIAEDSELLRDRMSGDQGELEFAAHAIVAEFVATAGSPEASSALLRILTSGNQAALRTVIALSYRHRDALGSAWWRILWLSILWCGLVVLAPRFGAAPASRQRWARWLRWLRSRSLTETNANVEGIDLVAVAQRVARLERRATAKEFAREHGKQFAASAPQHRSIGLDTHLLKAAFGWLFHEPLLNAPPSDLATRLTVLKALLWFELWPYADREDTEREDLPTQIGYEILPVIVKLLPGLSSQRAAELWEPVLRLGGSAHYLVGHFIDWWLQQIPAVADLDAFCAHWRAMIRYAMTAPQWNGGRRWFHGERLKCRILGCGSELWLDQVPRMQAAVGQMRDLYEAWAVRDLGRDEDNVAYFCGFLASSTGRLLRLEGIEWLQGALANDSFQWRRSRTASALINLLDVALSEDADEIARSIKARDAFLGLVAVLVKAQVSASLTLQERAKVRFAGGHQ